MVSKRWSNIQGSFEMDLLYDVYETIVNGIINNKNKTNILLLAVAIIALGNLGMAAKAQVLADYGDAPDNTINAGIEAYPGVPGRFPSLLDTANAAVPGNKGAYNLNVSEEWLAATNIIAPSTTVENDSKLVDNDEDDARVEIFCPKAFPALAVVTCTLLVSAIHVDSTAPDVPRYVNVLVDFDRNGRWASSILFGTFPREHVVVDKKIFIPPGESRLIGSMILLPRGVIPPEDPVWVRVTLTREPLNVTGWDGSAPPGGFAYGETEDHLVQPQLVEMKEPPTFFKMTANPYPIIVPPPLPNTIRWDVFVDRKVNFKPNKGFQPVNSVKVKISGCITKSEFIVVGDGVDITYRGIARGIIINNAGWIETANQIMPPFVPLPGAHSTTFTFSVTEHPPEYERVTTCDIEVEYDPDNEFIIYDDPYNSNLPIPIRLEDLGMPDNDSDGYANAYDNCPDEKEDWDGFQDSDGCRDPDNDFDTVADENDLCPIDKEDIEGVVDGDGCPDRGIAYSVMNLISTANTHSSITWAWTDPNYAEFDHVRISVDDVFKANVPKGVQLYSATGFYPGTSHTITVTPVTTSGYITEDWVNDTEITVPEIPPPVNQTNGVPDRDISTFLTNATDQSACRTCHQTAGTNISGGYSNTIGGVPTRHHSLVARSVINPLTGTPFACTDCHPSTPGIGQGILLDRSCVNCHNGTAFWADSILGAHVGNFTRPHHVNTSYASSNIGNPAANRTCNFCHGNFVNNYNDGHYKPSYATDFMITPLATFKATNFSQPDGLGGNRTWGGCLSCHLPDPNATPVIGSNHDNHHKEILGFARFGGTTAYQNATTPGAACFWCHVITPGGTSPLRFNTTNPLTGETLINAMEVRNSTIEQGDVFEPGTANITINGTGCEKCHGVPSLHNIQFNYVQNGPQGLGHINNNSDCSGCHDSWLPANTFVPGALVPSVDTVSPSVILAGTAATLTITGSNFQNGDYTSVVTVDGVTYTPSSITDSQITVGIPALTAGSHKLQLVKGVDTLSKLYILTVVPNPTITSAKLNLNSGIITITGTGFGTKPATNPAMYVSVNHVGNQIVSTNIQSWTNTQIKAKNPATSIGDIVTVMTGNSGETTATITS